MKKLNGTTIEEVDQVGEVKRLDGSLLTAACNRFLIGRGINPSAGAWKWGQRKNRPLRGSQKVRTAR